ncbi:MAG TPA: HAD-IC family P-type ATPase [Fibrobacteria bacterium]|nr:HAD-IC family P-type ATPase [Fibrobacteria bacterium]
MIHAAAGKKSAPTPEWLGERPWHVLEPEAVLAGLGTDGAGLSHEEAAARSRIAGANLLPLRPPPPLWRIFLRQFRSPLVYVLGVSAGLSSALGHAGDAGFIFSVLAVNALLGTFQEWKAEKGGLALRKLLRIRASAQRDGERIGIDAEAVVPGDILWIESGEKVPADIRLLETYGLEIDESLLTGESVAVVKDAAWTGPSDAPPAERLNIAFAGSVVRRGRGRGIAVSTGVRTVIGKLAENLLTAPDMPPPLVRRMERFSSALAVIVSAVCVGAGAFGFFFQHRPMAEMFFFTVALAVSAIPEGLPAAMAVALSVAVSRMARRGVIVRRLPAVEGLGSCTLIASDKTGTLTCNELIVREIRLPGGGVVRLDGEGFEPHGGAEMEGKPVADRDPRLERLVLAASLCNEGDLRRNGNGWEWRGDPTDVALLSLARKLGWRPEGLHAEHPRLGGIPFEAERRFAAAYHRVEGTDTVFVKGAPERVLAMCADAGPVPHAVAGEMAARGLRVLAFAAGPAAWPGKDATAEPSGLAFLGFTGMIDPLRPEARAAVKACREAGVAVWMVTGDHPLTALAIARDLGLADSPYQVLTGRDLQALDREGLLRAARTAKVFARVEPEQKLRLVEIAAALGHFVAVTGDGVNDAPALKAAHIGVSMGRSGTDVARDAAEIVLSDDNFASVVAGVEEGRIAYKNIRNVIAMQVSTAAAEVLICGLGVILDLPLPLLPVQLLWLNLITNGIQDVALAFEPGEGDELKRKPRSPEEPIFDRLMIERVLVAGGVMALLGLGCFAWMLRQGWDAAHARNGLLLFMVLFENIGIGNYRSETKSAFAVWPWKSPILLAGTVAASALHLAVLYLPPARRILGTAPVDLRGWAGLLALAAAGVAAVEAHKWLRRKWPVGHG